MTYNFTVYGCFLNCNIDAGFYLQMKKTRCNFCMRGYLLHASSWGETFFTNNIVLARNLIKKKPFPHQ